jgi:hypothetical protein
VCGLQRFCDFRERPMNPQTFWSRVNKNGPTVRPELGQCWLWMGPCDGRYGNVSVDGVAQKAHRFAFYLSHGRWPKPNGLHRCDVTLCVRPRHIFEGTQRDNMKDCAAKGRSNLLERRLKSAIARSTKRYCIHGHEYTHENTYRRSTGERGCKLCRHEATRRHRRKQ